MKWSIEILPGQIDKFHLIPKFISEVYVPWLPGSDSNIIISASERLIDYGKTPVPHIAARNLSGIKDFHFLLENLIKVKVDRVLMIAGSGKEARGSFTSVMDLLQTGIPMDYGIRKIDIAGHPEGNPYDAESTLHLEEKVLWSADNEVSMRIITQWSFDSLAINNWISGLRKKGIGTPIHIGIPGPAKMKTLLRYAKICGVKASAKLLNNLGFDTVKKMLVNRPDSLVKSLVGYDQLHLFTFGGLAESRKWLTQFIEN